MSQRQEPSALGRIVDLVRDLRERCPWDRVQTRETLRPYLVEEALELDHALGTGDIEAIRAEVGDVLLHMAFQIVLGEERGEFGPQDVADAVVTKMRRRHPHLFDLDDDFTTWERQKLKEHAGSADRSILDGLPPTLPALLMAFRLQERAAGVGFDWPDASGPRAKVTEELREVDEAVAADDPDAVGSELGDLLFSVVNLVRKLGHDPRATLEAANARFRRRFEGVERLAQARDVNLADTSLEELDRLWQDVKADQG